MLYPLHFRIFAFSRILAASISSCKTADCMQGVWLLSAALYCRKLPFIYKESRPSLPFTPKGIQK